MQYLFRRGGMWLVRLVVPERLRSTAGRREFIKSCRTYESSLAKLVAVGLLSGWRRQLFALEFPSMSIDLRKIAEGSSAFVRRGYYSLEDAAEHSGIGVTDLLHAAAEQRIRLYCRLPRTNGMVVPIGQLGMQCHFITPSGACKLRDSAPLIFDLLRAGDTLVVRWVDRLGRNYEDVSDNIRAFMRRGVVIKTIIHGMVFDGAAKDPMTLAVRDALIGFMAALSQAQAEATKEAQKVGIAHAKVSPNPQKPKTYLGRQPSYTENQISEVITLTGEGKGVSEIVKQLGLPRAAIYRVLKSPAEAFAAVRAWN